MPFSGQRRSILFALLLVITVAVYGNTFLNTWTYDDIPVVLENSDAHSFSGFLANSNPGRPLRELTYIPEYMFFGNEPSGYHVQQLIWHWGNGVLLFSLFAALGLEPLYALLGAILFIVHPLQAESVASIAHRKELLALFFSLCSVLAYIKGVRETGRRRGVLIAVSLAGYGVAILANQTAVTIPCVLILYDYLYLRQEDRVIFKHPWFVLFCSAILGSFALYYFHGLFSRDALLSVYSKNNYIDARSFLPLYLACLKAFGFYLYKISVPVNLAPEYVIAISTQMFQVFSLAGLALLLATVSIFFAVRRSAPLVAFGIGWYLVMYLPVSNIVPVAYIAADRYMYLCLPGVSIVVAALLQWRSQKWLNYVCIGILLLFSALTILQNTYWRNQHTLWRHAVQVNPRSAAVQNTVALSYMLTGELSAARIHAKKAIELYQYNIHYYLTLAKIEDRLGNLTEALKNYEIFVGYGGLEYPEEVAVVNKYLPLMRKRVAVGN